MTGPNPLLDFRGRITIPPVQFFVLATWHHLAADPNSAGPGTATTPSTADMVRVASLHPLELHQFGAELCEWILEDDFGVRREVESGRGLPRAVGYDGERPFSFVFVQQYRDRAEADVLGCG